VQLPGLYFPFVHVRDDDWLKVAALYWPSVRRLVPSGYSKHDTPVARVFVERGLLLDEDPGALLASVSWDLQEVLSENLRRLLRDYSVERAIASWDGQPWAKGEAGEEIPALGWIHVTKFPPNVADYLANSGLARRGRVATPGGDPGQPEDWLGLHPALAGAYMTALAGRLSAQAAFQPLTDQADLRVATPNSEVRAAVSLLLGREGSEPDPAAASVETYILLALEQVRPKHLENIPAERIVECREDLEGELDTFRTYVDSMRSDLSQLAVIPNERRRLESFTEHVKQTIERPLRDLEKGLRLHKLEPTRSLLLASSFASPAAIGAALAAGGAPPAAATAAGAMAAIGSAWWQVGSIRTQAKASSPVGYLLDVRDHLTPKTLTSEARKMLTGTYGRR
jgi:hypothetical protein